MRIVHLIAGMLLLAAPAQSEQAAPPLEGWWRAPLQHGLDQSEFYLHFERRADRMIARFSIPAISADDSPLGRVELDGDKVRIVEAQWTLERSGGGQMLRGTIPDALLPTYKIDGLFTRSAPPQQPSLPKGERAAPKPVWQAALGAPIIGGVAADPAARTIYVGTKAGRLSALAADSGRALWAVDLGSPIRTTPLHSGGGVFVATEIALHKLDPATGKIRWSRSLGKPVKPILEISDEKSRWDHYSASPVVNGGKVYVGSRDGCLYGFTAAAGDQHLKVCAKDQVTASPVVARDFAYFASFDHHLYAVRLDTGAVAWTADLAQPITRDLALTDGAVIAGSRSYDLRSFDARSGKPRWNRYIWFSWIDSAPAHDDGLLAIGSSDAQRIFAMNSRDGRPSWSTFIGGWAWAKPAISARTVYAGAVGTTMQYVGNRSGGLAALDRRDGRLLWLFRPQYDPKDVIWGFAADPLLAGTRLFAADLRGNVYAFDAD